MYSAVEPDNLEAALTAAVRRFDGASPVTAQVHHHFGYVDADGASCPRSRMHLVVEAALAEGGTRDDALDIGAAVEILYNYSLVHSDIEDGDCAREGREAVWMRYGLAHGINAGDALCAIAYLEVLSGCERRPPERTLLMTRVLQEANYAMCAGQAADIAFDAEERVALADYVAMMENKTGSLYGAAAQLGALSAGAGPERARAYARLGQTYGIALQIVDDVAAPSSRRWIYPAVAALAGDARDASEAARAYIAEADAIASAAGIDAGGRVRRFFQSSILRGR